MQFAALNGVTLHYQTIGIESSRPLLVFANSLGTDLRIWRDVVVRLAGEFAILTYDLRGHGLSDIGPTPYLMADHAADLAGLLDLLGRRPALLCGLSVGGMVVQSLYHSRPDLVRGLILCDTADRIGSVESWTQRIETVEREGIAAIADGVLEGWFTPAFRRDNPEFAGYRNMLTRQPVAGYVATCAALRDCDLRERSHQIDVPTLCVAGETDPTTSPATMAEFARRIPGARFEVIAGAGHIPPVEQPDRLAAIIRAFAARAGTETKSHVTH